MPWLNKDTSKGFCPCIGTDTTARMQPLKLGRSFRHALSRHIILRNKYFKSFFEVTWWNAQKNVCRIRSNRCIISDRCFRFWDTVRNLNIYCLKNMCWITGPTSISERSTDALHFSSFVSLWSRLILDQTFGLNVWHLDSHPFSTSFSYRSYLSFLSVKTEMTKLLGHTSQAFAMCCQHLVVHKTC